MKRASACYPLHTLSLQSHTSRSLAQSHLLFKRQSNPLTPLTPPKIKANFPPPASRIVQINLLSPASIAPTLPRPRAEPTSAREVPPARRSPATRARSGGRAAPAAPAAPWWPWPAHRRGAGGPVEFRRSRAPDRLGSGPERKQGHGRQGRHDLSSFFRWFLFASPCVRQINHAFWA